MFSDIDNKLIALAQWVERQFELLTPVSRKDLISVAINMFCTCVVIHLLFQLVVNYQRPAYLLLVGIVAWYLYDKQAELRKESKKEEKQGVLPAAINERRFPRLLWLYAAVINFLFSIPKAFFLLTIDFEDDLVSLLSWVYLMSFIVVPIALSLAEYLLCTTSLPPGEKERKKQEKEMRKAVPTAA